jgi:hypothetical protein
MNLFFRIKNKYFFILKNLFFVKIILMKNKFILILKIINNKIMLN